MVYSVEVIPLQLPVRPSLHKPAAVELLVLVVGRQRLQLLKSDRVMLRLLLSCLPVCQSLPQPAALLLVLVDQQRLLLLKRNRMVLYPLVSRLTPTLVLGRTLALVLRAFFQLDFEQAP